MGKMKIGGDTVLVLNAAPAVAGDEAKDEKAPAEVPADAPVEQADKAGGDSDPADAGVEIKDPSSPSSHCYDKTKSFFDSISCEAVERSKG